MNYASSLEAYIALYKKAKTIYNSQVSKGKNGYLPSLDGILKNTDVGSEVSLGIKEIPLNKIIGTNSHSRSTAFTKNFYPLAEPNSEFAAKWTKLLDAHLSEGIRDSITAYEYLNWFYVIEGNKRVSVMKYSDAFSITADVRRIIPKKSNDPVIRIYFEFMDFNIKTGIFTIWFSNPGCFKKLDSMLDDYNPKLTFNTTKYRHFIIHVYNEFRKIYHASGGKILNITTGDAILKYLEIYGIPQEITKNDEQQIKKFLDEIKEMTASSISVLTDAPEIENKNVITTLVNIFSPAKPLKIGFIFAKNNDESGWTSSHDEGRRHLETIFKESIETAFINNVKQDDSAYTDIKKLAEKNMDLIITTSPTFMNSTLKAALEYPKIKFLNCSSSHSYKNVSTFYGRVHEVRFLLGVLAGAITQTDLIGYIAHYPIPEVISGINAFALGAKFVNPNAIVIVKWNYKWDPEAFSTKPISELLNSGADLICQDDLPKPGKKSRGYGLYSPKYDFEQLKFVPDIHYGIIMWQWSIFYEKVVKSIINDTSRLLFDSGSSDSKRLNFWWGIDSGLLDIFYSTTHVPRSTQQLVEFLRRMIVQNELNPFSGPVFNQSGDLMVQEGENADYDTITTMNWFVDNVVGVIPKKKDIESNDPLTKKLGID
ncbi:MAG: BMP family ABC transporter substrate-binding protein [Spirochaetes bacterium]|nr:BMP family ABC transporter substrate-binding protein [Spirochaetota bacterium]